MTKTNAKDWQNLPIGEWNVLTFHEYLADKNRQEYGVEYVPFGKGPVGSKWRTEQGQIKNAQKTYGNEVVRKYIDKCFASHSFNPKYPVLSFGFMYSYMRNELVQAQNEVADEKRSEEIAEQTDVDEVDDDWF